MMYENWVAKNWVQINFEWLTSQFWLHPSPTKLVTFWHLLVCPLSPSRVTNLLKGPLDVCGPVISKTFDNTTPQWFLENFYWNMIWQSSKNITFPEGSVLKKSNLRKPLMNDTCCLFFYSEATQKSLFETILSLVHFVSNSYLV